jgi:large subunit ribosomal protein L21
MYAIVEIAGKQFRVTKDMKMKVPLLQAQPGNSLDFDRVLAFEDDSGNIAFGTPLLESTSVSATVIEHGRDKKIIVFKKKRRKGYQKKNGHRQGYSLIEITDIGKSKKAKPAAKTEQVAAVQEATKMSVKKAPKAKTAAKAKTTVKPKAAKKAAPKVDAQKVALTEKKVSAKKAPSAKTGAKSKTSEKPKVEKKAASRAKTKTATKKATPNKDIKED